MAPFTYDRSPLSDGSDLHLEFLTIRAVAAISYECLLYGYNREWQDIPIPVTPCVLGQNLRFWRKWVMRRKENYPLAYEVIGYLDELLLGLVEYLRE